VRIFLNVSQPSQRSPAGEAVTLKATTFLDVIWTSTLQRTANKHADCLMLHIQQQDGSSRLALLSNTVVKARPLKAPSAAGMQARRCGTWPKEKSWQGSWCVRRRAAAGIMVLKVKSCGRDHGAQGEELWQGSWCLRRRAVAGIMVFRRRAVVGIMARKEESCGRVHGA